MYGKQARLLWSLAASGLGTTISAAGNSGSYSWPPAASNPRSAIDLRQVTDVALYITVAGVTSTPSLNVYLDTYDDLGNLFAQQLKTAAAITAAGSTVLAGGMHGPSSAYLILPEWARVSWTCSGGSATGCEIALYGR